MGTWIGIHYWEKKESRTIQTICWIWTHNTLVMGHVLYCYATTTATELIFPDQVAYSQAQDPWLTILFQALFLRRFTWTARTCRSWELPSSGPSCGSTEAFLSTRTPSSCSASSPTTTLSSSTPQVWIVWFAPMPHLLHDIDILENRPNIWIAFRTRKTMKNLLDCSVCLKI